MREIRKGGEKKIRRGEIIRMRIKISSRKRKKERKREFINIYIYIFYKECNRAVYFQTTATLRRAVESDLLNVSLIAKLRQLEHPRIDCSGLINEYQDIQTVEVIAPDGEPQEVDLT